MSFSTGHWYLPEEQTYLEQYLGHLWYWLLVPVGWIDIYLELKKAEMNQRLIFIVAVWNSQGCRVPCDV